MAQRPKSRAAEKAKPKGADAKAAIKVKGSAGAEAALASPAPARAKRLPVKAGVVAAARPPTKAPPAKSKTAPTLPHARQAAALEEPRAAAPRRAAKTTKAETTKAETTKAKTTKAKRAPPAYLAAELGQPVDHEGEPVGAGSARVKSDTALQDYTLRLWRQMQSGGVVNRYTRAIERAGLTTDEVWMAGVLETRPTSSTPDEMRRYKQKLLFRANLLEAILSETVADLHRLDGIEPTPPKKRISSDTAGEAG